MIILLAWLLSAVTQAGGVALAASGQYREGPVILIGATEDGSLRTGQAAIWHDASGKADLAAAQQALDAGAFQPLESAGSTGLKKGSHWSYFVLHNGASHGVPLNLEYVDHQLIRLQAFTRGSMTESGFSQIVNLAMGDSFSKRPVFHNRFVVPVALEPGESRKFLLRFDSEEAGFVFPSLRIWTPEELDKSHAAETGLIAFLFGGMALVSLFSLIVGLTTRAPIFLTYSVYGVSKIVAWGTILGYTHQYVLRDTFHWSYMSASAALSILFAIIFDRLFLQSRKYTPKLDYFLILMMANAVLLLCSALLQIKPVALISITLALLLYPISTIVALVRWRQGSSEAAVFALGWTLLLAGLFFQALRDLGHVEHNLVNYYLPPLSSLIEMITIMAAMGLKLRRQRLQGLASERQYRRHLEQSKVKLAGLVRERTKALEQAKLQAELEARTDPLTGARNRRSFLADAALCIKVAQRKEEPVSLLMFDLDHFKLINDNHGHGVGDEALRLFTHTILMKSRETDVFGRLGGEEFALLVTETRQGALRTAERLRANTAEIRLARAEEGAEQCAVNCAENCVQFTVSIGVVHGEPGQLVEELLRQADQALYTAKKHGRNRVVEYAPGQVRERAQRLPRAESSEHSSESSKKSTSRLDDELTSEPV